MKTKLNDKFKASEQCYNGCIRKKKRDLKSINLSLYLKKLVTEEQTKHKSSRKKGGG